MLEQSEIKAELEKKLSRFAMVYQLNSSGKTEANKLVNSLAELEISFGKFSEVHLPKLIESASEKEVKLAINNLSTELSQILKQIKEPKSFESLSAVTK